MGSGVRPAGPGGLAQWGCGLLGRSLVGGLLSPFSCFVLFSVFVVSFSFLFIFFSVLNHFKLSRHFIKMCLLYYNYPGIELHTPNILV